MPLPDLDTEVKASSEAAESFVSHYYQAINNKSALLPFYINASTKYSITADISINGAVIAKPEEYQSLVEAQGANVRYAVESIDAQVMNPSFQFGAPENLQNAAKIEKNGGRMSIVVMTTGKTQFGKSKDAQQKVFNETLVLVPNWDALKGNPPKGARKWLIMSQNFRYL